MKPTWENRTDTKYSTQSVKTIAREARITKNWIKYGDKWYTPEELEAVAEERTFEDGKLFLRDPVNAIRVGRAYIDDLQQKLTDFNVKVAEYYKNRIK